MQRKFYNFLKWGFHLMQHTRRIYIRNKSNKRIVTVFRIYYLSVLSVASAASVAVVAYLNNSHIENSKNHKR